MIFISRDLLNSAKNCKRYEISSNLSAKMICKVSLMLEDDTQFPGLTKNLFAQGMESCMISLTIFPTLSLITSCTPSLLHQSAAFYRYSASALQHLLG